ncbi:MAG: hypothetical protein Q7S75_00335 [bacterium]|nr:hypothetical protein [bacterium]
MMEFLTYTRSLEPLALWINLVSAGVLSVTLYWLIRYTRATEDMKKEVIAQTDISTRPVMCLYVRYVTGVKDLAERESVREKYALTHEVAHGIVASPYYLALRNLGRGSAFNVSIESDNFVGFKYQTNFFAPESSQDEHAVKIIKKPSNKVRSIEELNNEIFVIRCESVSGKKYEYRYRIDDISERAVEYMLEI